MNETLKRKISLLPESPGCYLMKSQGEIIYVGKAVKLSNRVRSYFSGAHSAKVQAMVNKVDDFDILLCATNLEALMLECNLIKRHRPHYNIKLMDDKRYPYLRLSVEEAYPRLSVARKAEEDGARYFGPYIGTGAIRQVTGLLKRVFPLRSCKLKLPLSRPHRPCVNYEIGHCLGPCAGLCTKEEYGAVVERLIGFLKGRYKGVTEELTAQMLEASRQMQFERAAELRDCVKDIKSLMEKQNAQKGAGIERDIFGLAQDGMDAMAQVLLVRGGQMVQGQAFTLAGEGSEPRDSLMADFLKQYYEDRPVPREVLVPACEDMETMEGWLRQLRQGAVDLRIPERGEKKALLDNAARNAEDALQRRNAKKQVVYERTLGACAALGEIIGLPAPPRRIEGFDISNTQGKQSVASMVVFINGEADKKEYRRFHIKTVEGANDFASMNEVILRRLRRALEEGKERWPLPDLILVDGGPEQLAFAQRAMADLGLSLPMLGLAKRMEEIFLPGRELPLILPPHSPALHLLERVRDEAHRFAITFHRGLRDQKALGTGLESVPGIGPARRRALLMAFGTLRAIKEKSAEELAQAKGMTVAAAQALYAALHPDA